MEKFIMHKLNKPKKRYDFLIFLEIILSLRKKYEKQNIREHSKVEALTFLNFFGFILNFQHSFVYRL